MGLPQMQVKLQWLITGFEINGHEVFVLILTKSKSIGYTQLAEGRWETSALRNISLINIPLCGMRFLLKHIRGRSEKGLLLNRGAFLWLSSNIQTGAWGKTSYSLLQAVSCMQAVSTKYRLFSTFVVFF